ncbi:MAG: hypothetical protein MR601_08455 [Erysipelotrichaceae bacterium]|nr:hypothetical protein [Erysipelotrichaceae bacterium]
MLNKGYLLKELLISIFIFSIILLIYVPVIKKYSYNHLLFYDDYIYTQTKSMANKEVNFYESNYLETDYFISFNEKGNVNKAQTVKINNHTFVIELAGGRLLIK